MKVFQLTGTHPRVLLVNELHGRDKKVASTVLKTHSPMDKDCEMCKRTKMTRAPCRTRSGTAILRAEKVSDLIATEHEALSEGYESRNKHRFAVEVQDFATQWIQAYPCNTKNTWRTAIRRTIQKTNNSRLVRWSNRRVCSQKLDV